MSGVGVGWGVFGSTWESEAAARFRAMSKIEEEGSYDLVGFRV